MASTMMKLPLNFTFFKTNPGVLMHKYHSCRIARESTDGIKLLTAQFQRLEVINNIYKMSDLNVLLGHFQHLQYLTLTKIRVKSPVQDVIIPKGLVMKKLELVQTDYEVSKVFKLINLLIKQLQLGPQCIKKLSSNTFGNYRLNE